MSFLNELRLSLENEDVLGDNAPVTVEEEAEANVAAAEAEVVRQEIENNVQQVERAEAVVDELELTNDALAGAVAQSEDGTIPAETAAMVEAQRRTAAVALNLDPEQGAGADLVDNPGLESLVKGGVSLEDATEKNKTMIQRIKDIIKKISAAIKAGWRRFEGFIAKVLNILPKQIQELAPWVKSSKDLEGLLNKYSADNKEEYATFEKELPSAKGTGVVSSGGVKNIEEAIKAVVSTKNMGELNTVLKSKVGNVTIVSGKYTTNVSSDNATITITEANTPAGGITAELLKEVFEKGVKDLSFIKDINGVIASYILKSVANAKQAEAKEGEELTFEQKRQNCVNKLLNVYGKTTSYVINFYKNAVKLVKELKKIEAAAESK